ncbi:MAG: HD domain-containing protein [Planctomycetes bacterium]|nr:HD domain-containing protein [Planctomycetota bacterium]
MLVAEGTPGFCADVAKAMGDELTIVCARTPEAALARAREDFAVAMVDLRFPGGGLRLVEDLTALSPDTHILLYGHDPTADELEHAINYHVAGFIRLPFNPDLLRERVSHLLQAPPRTGALGSMVSKLHTEVRTRNDLLLRARRAGLLALARLAEHRDTETGLHVERVAALSEELTRLMREAGVYADQISGDFEHAISMGAALHDIGKVAIPDTILRKPGALTNDEFELMKTHCVRGWEVIEAGRKADGGADPDMKVAADVIRHHHERWDGTGYPDGLRGEEAPLAARIVAVIDAYDAMRSQRVYNPERASNDAVAEIRRCVGTQFDPLIAEVFLANVDKLEEIGRSIDRITARWR